MDFLPRYFASCALVGAFCLAFSAPAFAIDIDDPNYSWRLSSSGDVYRVYDPAGSRASSTFTPSSTFSEGNHGGAFESFAPEPLTIDGLTGEVVSDLSRSLSVDDLLAGLNKMVALDNPIGITILGVSTLAPFATAIYDYFQNSSPISTYPTSYTCSGVSISVPSGSLVVPNGNYNAGSCEADSGYCVAIYDPANGLIKPTSVISCPDGAQPVPASTVPSNLPDWISSHWASDNLSSDATSALDATHSFDPALATQLAANDVPLSTPVPYLYSPTSNTLAESPTTTTSTNPSTGNSISTVSTPSFNVSPGTDGGLSVSQTDSTVTSSCTSAGSCTVTNTFTDSQPLKASSPFVSPTISVPTSSTSSVKSFALSFVVPAQSDSVCPQPLSFTAFSNAFTIPLTPLCNLATDVNPYVESLGAVGAGIVIFR